MQDKNLYKIILHPLLLISLILSIPQIIVGYYEGEFTSIKYIPGLISWGSFIIIPYIAFLNRPYLLIVCGLLIVYSASNLFYILTFHGTLSAQAIYAVFETNITEAIEFGETFLNLKTVLIPTLYIASMLWLLIRIKPVYINMHRRIFLIAIAVVLFLPYGVTAYFKHYPLFGPYQTLISAYAEYKREISLIGEENNRINERARLLKADSLDYNDEQLYIIIIGESTNRNHMRLYGYKRDTTPLLSAIQSDLIIFTDVISSNIYTIPSLRSALTISSNEQQLCKGLSIIDLARVAGFKVFWISNQVPIGAWENTVTMIAKRADKSYFLNLTGSSKEALMFRRSYDEKVIEPLNQILNKKDKKRLIIIHLMGIHPSYKKRYPPSYNRFKDSIINDNMVSLTAKKIRKINDYDNALLYQDYVISSIIKTIKNYSGKNIISAILYFSDHGEEIYDFRDYNGRDPLQISRYQIEIPFIVWASEAFKRQRGHTYNLFLKNQHQSFMTDELIFTLFDFIGINSDCNDKTKSLFNSFFSPKKRIIFNKDYDAELKIQ